MSSLVAKWIELDFDHLLKTGLFSMEYYYYFHKNICFATTNEKWLLPAPFGGMAADLQCVSVGLGQEDD